MVLGCYLLLRSLVFAAALAAPRRRVGVAVVWYLPLQLSSEDAGLYAPLSLGVALSELLGFWGASGRIASPVTLEGSSEGFGEGYVGRLVLQFRGLPLSHSHSLIVRRSVLRSKSARVRPVANHLLSAGARNRSGI